MIERKTVLRWIAAFLAWIAIYGVSMVLLAPVHLPISRGSIFGFVFVPAFCGAIAAATKIAPDRRRRSAMIMFVALTIALPALLLIAASLTDQPSEFATLLLIYSAFGSALAYRILRKSVTDAAPDMRRETAKILD